ncbi:MAG TPA: hypothetical protein VI321_03945 [Burkholderiales bacterium]
MIQVLACLLAASSAAFAQGPLKVVSQKTVGGFMHVESVAYDPLAKALYASEFGAQKLDPALKDGKGRIVKLDLEGKVLEARFLPGAGGQALNKPKGIWVKGSRLWVTDIDAVWIFDLKTKKGRKLALPEAKFANDSAVVGNALYVSDNQTDKVFRVVPADFLDSKAEPQVSTVLAGKDVGPNGLYPARGGGLLVAGFSPGKANPVHALGANGQLKALSDPIGSIDGLYQMKDGSLLGTDWKSGSLFHWSRKDGMQKLATGFKGPADFCVIPGKDGLIAVVPDLVQGSLRFARLSR